jgi:cell division septation protein DedD
LNKGSHVVARVIALAAALVAINCLRIASAANPGAAPTPPPQPVEIDKNSALILIRSALIAVQQANQTGNYTVLYSLSAPGFQSMNSPERLSQIFANLRAKNFDLSGILVLEPQLTVLPELYSNGTLRMAGFFPSVPIQVFFELQFTPVQGQWRLLAIGVNLGGATPAAPTPNPALSSSHSATPAVTATPTPTATPTATQSSAVDVNVKPKPTPTPKPRQAAAPVRP